MSPLECVPFVVAMSRRRPVHDVLVSRGVTGLDIKLETGTAVEALGSRQHTQVATTSEALIGKG